VTVVFLELSRPNRRCSSTSSSSRSSEARASVALAIAALGFFGTLLVAPEAHAIERQHHLGLAPTLGILQIDGKSTSSVGLGGTIHYAYGLTDQFNLTAEAGSVLVAADQKQDFDYSPKNRPATVYNGSVGVAYVIDILRWVPYVGVQAGLYQLAGGTMPSALFLPGASAGVGLDYQLNRQFAIGVAGRQHFMFTKLDTYPSYTTVQLRFEYMWGY
jgi:hypothetical protein